MPERVAVCYLDSSQGYQSLFQWYLRNLSKPALQGSDLCSQPGERLWIQPRVGWLLLQHKAWLRRQANPFLLPRWLIPVPSVTAQPGLALTAGGGAA